MAVRKILTYENWRQSRIHLANVAGIDVLFRVVSNNLLVSKGEELLGQVSEIEQHNSHSGSDDTWIALNMRSVLDTILPDVLQSPMWLLEALDDFTDSEIISLYNAIIYSVGVKRAGSGTQREKDVHDDIDDVPF